MASPETREFALSVSGHLMPGLLLPCRSLCLHITVQRSRSSAKEVTLTSSQKLRESRQNERCQTVRRSVALQWYCRERAPAIVLVVFRGGRAGERRVVSVPAAPSKGVPQLRENQRLYLPLKFLKLVSQLMNKHF